MNTRAQFQVGHAEASDWQEAADACLRQMGEVSGRANLGFVYTSDVHAQHLAPLVEYLRAATGIEHWTGTVGVAICVTGREYYESPAMAVMVGALPRDSFRILPFYNRAADNLPGSWDGWLASSSTHLAVVHGDPANGLLPQLLLQLSHELPGGYLVGGLTSSHGARPQVADAVLDGGLSGVVFNREARVVTGLTQGCSLIAGKHRVTDCDGNVVNSIDGLPALDVFKQDIGEILARDLSRAAGYIFAGLPVRGSDTGDYLVRNLIGIDVKGKRLAIGDVVHEGQQIQFCRRDGETAHQDMQRMLEDLRERTGGERPRGGLYFSCLGRGRELFGEDSAELQMIRRTLGDFPLVGFFANGEISNQRLYGYTGVLTLFV
ncbi:MAG: FIST C-terminal domain-containing protein [Gammaproteobacteria bacterium]|jgi:small ligand-binding sensory domain FIST